MTDELEALRYHNTDYGRLLKHFAAYDRGPKPEPCEGFPTRDEVVIASEWEDTYEGALWIVWQREGKLYEMQASHCSCNSFADEAHAFKKPRETTVEAIRMRPHWSLGELRGVAAVAMDALLEGSLLRGPLRRAS
jgi:hypothetical protein